MDKTVVEIDETLFSEHGIPAPDTSGIITPPPPQHYSVQWNETDLDYPGSFLHRLVGFKTRVCCLLVMLLRNRRGLSPSSHSQ